jgi:uncharacterized protein YukE
MNRQTWGADSDDLDSLARDFGVTAQRLDRILRNVSVGLANAPWQGPAANRFRADWNKVHRARLANASHFLRDGEARLRRNADAQRHASAAEGGSGSSHYVQGRGGAGWLSAVGDGLRSAWGAATRAESWSSWALGPLGILTLKTTGRYTNLWRSVITATGPFMKYKSSPLLTGLNRLAPYRWAHRVAGVVDGFPLVQAAGRGFAAISFADKGLDLVDAVRRGDAGDAIGTGVDAAAAGLKMSKNPVAYLIGVNLSVWSDVVEEAGEVDFRQGLPNPLAEGSWSNIYVPALKETGRDLLGMAKGWFT